MAKQKFLEAVTNSPLSLCVHPWPYPTVFANKSLVCMLWAWKINEFESLIIEAATAWLELVVMVVKSPKAFSFDLLAICNSSQ